MRRPRCAQLEAQHRMLQSTRGEYFPTLGVQFSGTLASRDLPTIVPNLSGGLNLAWPIYLSTARAALVAALGRN